MAISYYYTNKKRFVTLLAITLIIGSLQSFKNANINVAIEKGATPYFLIKNTANDSIPNHTVFFIPDKLTVDSLKTLFLNNNRYGHGCDYPYEIQFWESSKKMLLSIPYSPECERFSKHNEKIKTLLNNKINLLKRKPSNYLYNLQVNMNKQPEMLMQEFAKAGYVVLKEDSTNHLSQLTFSYRQNVSVKNVLSDEQLERLSNQNKVDAVYQIDEMVDKINELTLVKTQSGVTFPMHSFSGETIVDEAEITIQLASGVNHMQIRELIKANGGKVETLASPESYFVQLVHESNNLSEIEMLTNEFDYIKKVYAYPLKNNLKLNTYGKHSTQLH